MKSGPGVPPMNHAQDAHATTKLNAGGRVYSFCQHPNRGGPVVPPVNHAQDARATIWVVG